jgi:Endosomal/lysosomal potassium channel TMEM175
MIASRLAPGAVGLDRLGQLVRVADHQGVPGGLRGPPGAANGGAGGDPDAPAGEREGDELGAGGGLTRDERRRDPSRVLALTDGVYAIIITLLVLDIHVPELSAHETLGSAISDVRPSFISFTIAFIVAAMQWVGHRDLFTLIRDTDRGVVWLNLLTLFAACLLPFGSALLSRYPPGPAGAAHVRPDLDGHVGDPDRDLRLRGTEAVCGA